jgi:hypothetical protein
MLKHVPFKYSQRKLLKFVCAAGFSGTFDYLYLPMDAKRRNNRGFAFLNFLTPSTTKQFYSMFHECFIDDPSHTGGSPLEVTAADVQGFENNVEHFVSTHAHRRQGKNHPCLLRRLPPRLMEKARAAGFSAADFEMQATPLAQDKSNRRRTTEAHRKKPAAAIPPATCGERAPKDAVRFEKQEASNMGMLHAKGEVSAKHRYCYNCGRQRDGAHSFCPFCGADLQPARTGTLQPSLQQDVPQAIFNQGVSVSL